MLRTEALVGVSTESYFGEVAYKKITNRKQLTDEQYETVVDLVMGNCDFHKQFDADGYSGISRKDLYEYVNSVLENRTEFIMVAVASNKVGGIAIGGHYRRYNKKYVSIYDIFVGEDFRRMGVGSKLLDKVAEEKIDGKPLIVELGVYGDNQNAVNLYEQWGMTAKIKRMRRVL